MLSPDGKFTQWMPRNKFRFNNIFFRKLEYLKCRMQVQALDPGWMAELRFVSAQATVITQNRHDAFIMQMWSPVSGPGDFLSTDQPLNYECDGNSLKCYVCPKWMTGLQVQFCLVSGSLLFFFFPGISYVNVPIISFCCDCSVALDHTEFSSKFGKM